MDFGVKYQVERFDENDANQDAAERSRQAVLSAYMEVFGSNGDDAPRFMEFTLAGLLVGLIQVMQSSASGDPDIRDAAIRSSIIEQVGWAVDFARTFQNLPPMSDRN